MQSNFRSNQDPLASRVSQFSNEVEAKRRRKSPGGPQGRADRPIYRPGSGGTSGSSGGLTGGTSGSSGGFTGGTSGGGFDSGSSGSGFDSGSSGGSWLPTSGGSRGRIPRIPFWLIILVIILLVVCVGGGFLKSLFGGLTEGGVYTQEQYPQDQYAVTSPTSTPRPVVGFTPNAASKDGSWTVMLYQDGDDQILEQDIFLDFNEVEMVGSTDQVNIIAQLDRYRGAFTGDGNWTGTRRYYVTRDNDLNSINSQLIADLGELNMSDTETLVDFVTWTAENFPADHYVLIMSDHGMGWPGGWTDPAPTSYTSQSAPLAQKLGNAIYLDQLNDALRVIQQQTGIEKFDLIGLDACLMGQLEVLSVLEPYAKYTVFSEESEPAVGWAYASFLSTLTQNPGMSGADLAKLIVQSYITQDQRILNEQARDEYLSQMGRGYYSADQVVGMVAKNATLSAIDLSKVPALMDCLNNLAYALQNSDQNLVAAARSYALSFTSLFGSNVPPSYIDLGSFVQILAQESRNSTIQQLSQAVYTAIDNAVIQQIYGSGKKGASGISFYFPNSALYRSPYAGPNSYTVIADSFAEKSLWDDFLAFHYNSRGFEPDTREPVIPSSGFPSRSPGAGELSVSSIQLTSGTASPGNPVTMRADITGTNIGNIYLFIGYYDEQNNAIFVADSDFLESPNTQQVNGVYYPKWSDNEPFTLKFEWDPTVFTISDGVNESVVALFTPRQYGASAEDAIYTVEGIYTFASSGEQLNAYINFRDGEMVNVFGITGSAETGAPREIVPQYGDTFTLLDKWLQLDEQGNVTSTDLFEGQTLQFTGKAFTWGEEYAAPGSYIIGFLVTDLDGNSQQVLTPITVE